MRNANHTRVASPLITVIIPVHNRHALFEKCLGSVINQNIDPNIVEVIIVDEASSPPISGILPVDSRFRISILRNRRALGPSLARNIGLRKAKGKFIAFLDSDDIWHPDFLCDMTKNINPASSVIITSLGWSSFSGSVSLYSNVYYQFLSLVRAGMLAFFFLIFNGLLPYQWLFLLRLSSTIFTRRSLTGISFSMAYRTGEDWKFIWDCLHTNSPAIRINPKFMAGFTYDAGSETLRRKHYWGYYYKLLDELPNKLRNSVGMKISRVYVNYSVWKNKSYEHLTYYPRT